MSQNSQNNQNEPDNNSGCLAPILYIGSLPAFMGICKFYFSDDPETANTIFIWGALIWVLFPILFGIIGKNLKETTDNIANIMRLIGIIVMLTIGYAIFVPASCSTPHSSDSADAYYRR